MLLRLSPQLLIFCNYIYVCVANNQQRDTISSPSHKKSSLNNVRKEKHIAKHPAYAVFFVGREAYFFNFRQRKNAVARIIQIHAPRLASGIISYAYIISFHYLTINAL